MLENAHRLKVKALGELGSVRRTGQGEMRGPGKAQTHQAMFSSRGERGDHAVIVANSH